MLNASFDLQSIHFAPAQEQWTISLDMALSIDEMWRARNHILFQDGKAVLLKAKQNVHAKFIEFSKVFSPVIHPSPEQSIAAWSSPPETGSRSMWMPHLH